MPRALLSQSVFLRENQAPYRWDSNLETGYQKIDNQHKQLIATVNKLMEASLNGKGSAVIMETLAFLKAYTINHFTDEEQLAIDYEYPDYQSHKKLHDDFRIVVGKLIHRVEKEGPTRENVGIVISTIDSWLLNHIKGDDFKLAAFVKAADARAMAE